MTRFNQGDIKNVLVSNFLRKTEQIVLQVNKVRGGTFFPYIGVSVPTNIFLCSFIDNLRCVMQCYKKY